MAQPVKAGAGKDPRTEARAAVIRESILQAAHALFIQCGYAGTTDRDIAVAAGVPVAAVGELVGGGKPEIMLALLERAVTGSGDEERQAEAQSVDQAQLAVTARQKIEAYAAAMRQIQPRIAPLVAVLKDAAAADHRCAQMWRGISEQRASNLRQYAADLRTTGELRIDLSDEDVADFLWSMNAPEFYLLLVERGWTPARYERLIVDVCTRTLLTFGPAPIP